MVGRVIEVIKRGPKGDTGDPGILRTSTIAAAHTAILLERAYLFKCTANLTFSLTAAATLGDGWFCWVKAVGGDVTIDPDGAETINGASTHNVPDGNTVIVYTDGTAFFTIAEMIGFTVSAWAETLLDDLSAAEARATIGVNEEANVNARTTVLTGGAADAYTITAADTITAYAAAQVFSIRLHAANTTAVTIAIDGLAAKSIKKYNNSGTLIDLASGDLKKGDVFEIEYDGTDFFLKSQPSSTTTKRGPVEQSTSAENVAGTSDTVFPSVAGAREMIVKNNSDLGSLCWESSEITLATIVDEPHGRGGVPDWYSVSIRCKTTDLGWAVDDEIPIGAHQDTSGVVTSAPYCNAANVGWRTSSISLRIPDKTTPTGAPGTITPANWKLVFRASLNIS